MFYELPPAGNAVIVPNADQRFPMVERQWEPFSVRWYGSGTSALAASLIAAVARRKHKAPEVLVPAYGCPDVVSAILCAGATPVFIDLASQRPWLDLEQIERRVGPATVAIVAINFLGIPERVERLRALADTAGITLIEDYAQSFPLQQGDVMSLGGDFVVLSFGRGKPVSMLGGGAVLSRTEELARLLPHVRGEPRKRDRGAYRLRVAAYNLLRAPRAYWLLNALPFLGLGKTEFAPHPTLEPAPDFIGNLAANVAHYRKLGDAVQRGIRAALRTLPSAKVIDLVEQCGKHPRPRLLRYPLLVPDRNARDRIDSALRRAGLGSSRMYRRPMMEISGIRDAVRTDAEFPNARRFAESLLTLPTHSHVRQVDIDRMSAILRRELGQRG